jgi:hypothetical protein
MDGVAITIDTQRLHKSPTPTHTLLTASQQNRQDERQYHSNQTNEKTRIDERKLIAINGKTKCTNIPSNHLGSSDGEYAAHVFESFISHIAVETF